MTTTRNDELLSNFIDLMNEHGRESQEVKDFLEAYKDNEELVKLAKAAIEVSEAFDGGIID